MVLGTKARECRAEGLNIPLPLKPFNQINMRVTLKEVISSDSWVVTAIHQGYGKAYRVDARRRFRVADMSSFFSDIGSPQYINKLCREHYGKNANQMRVFKY